MENKFLKATKLFAILIFLFSLNSCKQNQSLTKAKYEDLDKIAVEGQKSVYEKKQSASKNTELEVLEETSDFEIASNTEAKEKLAPKSKKASVDDRIGNIKEVIEQALVNKNTARAQTSKTSFKEKVKRSKLAFKHIKQLNKIKKALKKDKSNSNVSILLLIIAILLALILLALIGIDLIALLILTLLVLLIYILLTS